MLSEWLTERCGAIWIVHRLDLETSGVVMFARNEEAHREANAWFSQRKTKKTYYCLAQGVPSMPMLRLNAPIEGSPSLTQIEVVESYEQGFLAKVRIGTGRRHQIRIHLSGAGFPIWGDRHYRGAEEICFDEKTLPIPRVALHASRLELPSGESFEAPWAEDFSQWVEYLRTEGTRV